MLVSEHDSASNNDTMDQQIECKLVEQNIVWDEKHYSVKCACHQFGLVVNAAMKALGLPTGPKIDIPRIELIPPEALGGNNERQSEFNGGADGDETQGDDQEDLIDSPRSDEDDDEEEDGSASMSDWAKSNGWKQVLKELTLDIASARARGVYNIDTADNKVRICDYFGLPSDMNGKFQAVMIAQKIMCSPIRRAEYRVSQGKFPEIDQRDLIIPNNTRWNNRHDCRARLLEQQKVSYQIVNIQGIFLI